ncbi:MAG: lysoplasmalogenase [Candidatus Promineifilaceae bacterium]
MITTLYITLSALYLLFQDRTPTRLVLLKAAPILLLASWCIWIDAPRMLTIALLLSAAGDIALGLDGERYFVQGLGFFLLAHVAYVWIFGRSLVFTLAALLPIAFTLLIAILLIPRLYPVLGKLRIPVLFYVSIIIAMGLTAALHSPFNLMLVTGAIIFMLSDATIAVDKFVQPVAYRNFIVMFTYYLAQYLIVVAFLRDIF